MNVMSFAGAATANLKCVKLDPSTVPVIAVPGTSSRSVAKVRFEVAVAVEVSGDGHWTASLASPLCDEGMALIMMDNV